MSKKSKTKGAGAEREVAKALSLLLDLPIERNLEQSRGGGYDLKGLEELGLAIEVKRQEKLRIDLWWQQAKQQATNQLKPVLCYKQSYKPWKVIINLQDFINLKNEIMIETSLEHFTLLIKESHHE